jgi:hypothetical protein
MMEVIASLLLALGLGWPILVVLAGGMIVHVVVVTVRRRWQRPWLAWREVSAAAVCAALAIYGAAYFYGGFFSMDPEDPCQGAGYGYSDVARQPSSMWPLSNPMCVSETGTVDLVPAFVNPAVVGLAVLSVACVFAAVVVRRRSAHVL